MENNLNTNKSKQKNIMMIILGGVILLTVLYLITLFVGGSILSLLGLKYGSFSSLAKFIAIYTIISLPIDLFIDCFFKVAKQVKNLTSLQHNLIFFSVDIPINMLILGIIESFMKDIECSMGTAFLFSIVCCFINYMLDDKDEKKDITNNN